MTREELAEEIALMLTEHRADGVLADHTADAVIRLVVEACCERLTVLRGRVLKDGFAAFAVGVQEARRDLMQTFLPTTEPTDG